MRTVLGMVWLIASMMAASASGASMDLYVLSYAKDGDAGGLQGAVGNGGNINVRDKDGLTPLMIAARINDFPHQDTCKVILDFASADVNAVDKRGYTALQYAKEAGNQKVVDLLLARGADPNIKPGAAGSSGKPAGGGSPSTQAGGMNAGDYLLILGLAVAFVGGIMFLVVAFREGKGWGIAIVVSNIVANRLPGPAAFLGLVAPLIFLFTHWRASCMAFFVQVTGWILLFAGAFMGPQSQLGKIAAGVLCGSELHSAADRPAGDGAVTVSREDHPAREESPSRSTAAPSRGRDMAAAEGSLSPGTSSPRSTSSRSTPSTAKTGSPVKERDFDSLLEKDASPPSAAIAKPTAAPTPAKSPSLIAAVKSGDMPQLLKLLESGEPPDATDGNGWTALMHATSKGNAEMVQSLLGKSADPNVSDSAGWTPLLLAARGGNRVVVQSLLDKKADVQAKTRRGTTALMCAAGKGHQEVVRMLIDARADVNARDADGKTALSYATEESRADVVELLKKAGAVAPAAPAAAPPAGENVPATPPSSRKEGAATREKRPEEYKAEAEALSRRVNAQPTHSGDLEGVDLKALNDPKVAVPELIKQLQLTGNADFDNGDGREMRMQAAVQLKGFRKDAKDAIPSLEKAMKDDPDPDVREAAKRALQLIR